MEKLNNVNVALMYANVKGMPFLKNFSPHGRFKELKGIMSPSELVKIGVPISFLNSQVKVHKNGLKGIWKTIKHA